MDQEYSEESKMFYALFHLHINRIGLVSNYCKLLVALQIYTLLDWIGLDYYRFLYLTDFLQG